MADIPEWATKKTFHGIKRSPDQFVTRECRALSKPRSYVLDSRDQAGVVCVSLETLNPVENSLLSHLPSRSSTQHLTDFEPLDPIPTPRIRKSQSEPSRLPDFGHVNRMPVDTATGNIENEGTVQVRDPDEIGVTKTQGIDRQNHGKASSFQKSQPPRQY